MISLGLVFFGFGTKDSPLLRTSISAVVSTLYFVAQFDYCVCDVRLFKFAGVWLFGGLFLLYASGVIAGHT